MPLTELIRRERLQHENSLLMNCTGIIKKSTGCPWVQPVRRVSNKHLSFLLCSHDKTFYHIMEIHCACTRKIIDSKSTVVIAGIVRFLIWTCFLVKGGISFTDKCRPWRKKDRTASEWIAGNCGVTIVVSGLRHQAFNCKQWFHYWRVRTQNQPPSSSDSEINVVVVHKVTAWKQNSIQHFHCLTVSSSSSLRA